MGLHEVSLFVAISVHMKQLICNPHELSILIHACECLDTLICVSTYVQ